MSGHEQLRQLCTIVEIRRAQQALAEQARAKAEAQHVQLQREEAELETRRDQEHDAWRRTVEAPAFDLAVTQGWAQAVDRSQAQLKRASADVDWAWRQALSRKGEQQIAEGRTRAAEELASAAARRQARRTANRDLEATQEAYATRRSVRP